MDASMALLLQGMVVGTIGFLALNTLVKVVARIAAARAVVKERRDQRAHRGTPSRPHDLEEYAGVGAGQRCA